MDFSSEQTLRRLVDYMPDFYKTNRQFIDSVEFLEHREWELALDCIIELADETEHYFAEDFWLGLADSAEKMNLKDKANISEKLKEEWATERREKDKVQELFTKEGVHLKSHGRSGFLYITDNGKIAEVEFELGINGIIIYFNSLTNWTLPSKQPLTDNEKTKIKINITNWATKTKNVIEFDD